MALWPASWTADELRQGNNRNQQLDRLLSGKKSMPEIGGKALGGFVRESLADLENGLMPSSWMPQVRMPNCRLKSGQQ